MSEFDPRPPIPPSIPVAGPPPLVHDVVTAAPPPAIHSRRERIALLVLQLGAVLVVLLATTYKEFELDRYFVPKELVLHATALIGGLLAVRSLRQLRMTRVDLLLIAFMAVSFASAVFATNRWFALRALAVSAAGVMLFWIARVLRQHGRGPALLAAVAVATVLAAGTSLLQTYGVETELFSINRAPGGTLGNRNFIAHIAAIGLPVLIHFGLRVRRVPAFALCAIGVAIVLATLVITRSRAGWLAAGGGLGVFVCAVLLSGELRRRGQIWRRTAGMMLLAAAGVVAAIFIPNTLRWASANPYLESIQGVANYQEGSGRGRLIQYRQSLRMALQNPVLGVGPGNWPVEYPDHAARNDPSLARSTGGRTSNPWPSSDWVAHVSERGPAAALLLALAFLGMFVNGIRTLRRTTADDALAAATLLATIAATMIAGAFDAVLLLAPPTLLAWAAFGALSAHDTIRPGPLRPRAQRLVIAAMLLLCGLGAVRSAAQVTVMGIFESDAGRSTLARAAWIDPANYELRMRLARGGGSRADRCRHARAAVRLFPHAHAARERARSCD